MTQQEYNFKRQKCYEEYLRKQESEGISSYSAFLTAFNYAYALGKQESKQETVVQGWVARDEEVGNNDDFIELPADSFPYLKWESEPEQVEIILKRKNNG